MVAVLVVIAILLEVVAGSPFLGLGKTLAPQVVASEKPLVTEGGGTPSLLVVGVTPTPPASPTLWPTPLLGARWMTPSAPEPPLACTAKGSSTTLTLNDGDNFKIGKESYEWDMELGVLGDGPYGPREFYWANLSLWQGAANQDGTYRIYRCGYDKFVIWEAAKLLPLLPTPTPPRTPVLIIER